MSGSRSCMFARLDSLMYMYMDFYSYILALQNTTCIYYYVVMVFYLCTSTCTLYVTVQDVEHTNGLLVSKYTTLSEVVVRYKTHSLQQRSDCCGLQSIPPYSCPQDWESDRDSGATPLPPDPSQPHHPLPRLTSTVDPHHVCQRPHHLYNNVHVYIYLCAHNVYNSFLPHKIGHLKGHITN